jgi:hypothetical protein
MGLNEQFHGFDSISVLEGMHFQTRDDERYKFGKVTVNNFIESANQVDEGQRSKCRNAHGQGFWQIFQSVLTNSNKEGVHH